MYEPVAADQPAVVIKLTGGFDIVAPWGEHQHREWGYLMLKGGEVYGIYGPIFDATYERCE